MSNLSTAPFSIPVNQVQQQSYNYTTLPQSQSLGVGFLGDVALNQQSDATLSYPNDTPKYVLTFSFSQYFRQDLNSVGQFIPAPYPGIVLPMPGPMVDRLDVDWREVEVGTLPGAAINIAAGTLPSSVTNPAARAGFAAAGVALPTAGLTALNTTNALTGGAAGQAAVQSAQGIEALVGVSPNQFVTLLMRGPKYKRHTFDWQFSPANFKEADTLREIVRTFKNAMSPNFYSITSSSSNPGLNAPILWQFPKIFHVRIYPNSKFMYKFKPCICDQFAVNYTPGGRGAFYHDYTGDGNDGGGGNAPEGIQIQMHLIELEYWTEGNFSASNNPDEVYTGQSAGAAAESLSSAIGAGEAFVKSVLTSAVTPAF